MKRIESYTDDMRGMATYELSDGRYVVLDALAVKRYGAAAILEHMGLPVPQGRLPVLQHGRQVGTLPAVFDPHCVTSRHWLYDPRPGDFRRVGETFVASDRLGSGDLEAVSGFVAERAPALTNGEHL